MPRKEKVNFVYFFSGNEAINDAVMKLIESTPTEKLGPVDVLLTDTCLTIRDKYVSCFKTRIKTKVFCHCMFATNKMSLKSAMSNAYFLNSISIPYIPYTLALPLSVRPSIQILYLFMNASL